MFEPFFATHSAAFFFPPAAVHIFHELDMFREVFNKRVYCVVS